MRKEIKRIRKETEKERENEKKKRIRQRQMYLPACLHCFYSPKRCDWCVSHRTKANVKANIKSKRTLNYATAINACHKV